MLPANQVFYNIFVLGIPGAFFYAKIPRELFSQGIYD